MLDLLRAGAAFEPELTTAQFTEQDYRDGLPKDGLIIANRSYDMLKRERTAQELPR